MDNPRPEKVAVVTEVRERFEAADAALLTEYRGIGVAGMATLRRALREAGGDYKIYKNTLVRLAARDAGLDIADLLTGPTAIAFVTTKPDGTPGDAVTVAKALRDFARTNPTLVVKGALLGDKLLSADHTRALAEVAPREELLARFAGGLAAPLQQFAGLLSALPRNLAYGLKALIDQGGGPDAPTDAPAPEPEPAAAESPDSPDSPDSMDTPEPVDSSEQSSSNAPPADPDAAESERSSPPDDTRIGEAGAAEAAQDDNEPDSVDSPESD